MRQDLEVEVFRAGDYGAKGRWSEEALERLAADYDPALHEAPVTLDHAQQGPALGWVEALRRVGDRLVARLRGLNGRLLELVREGSFKKRSVEIYPALRETGRPYLRAVSFLGASVPEVKGLADPLPFAEAGGEAPASLIFEEEPGAGGESLSEALGAMPGDGAPAPGREPRDAEPGDATPGEHKQASGAVGGVAFAELGARLRQAGKWRPAWSERGIEQFFGALAAVDEIEVGEGQCVNAAEWFAAFLESLPPVVEFAETAPGAFASFGELVGPEAPNVDQGSLALHREAVAFRQTHPSLSYAEALMRCASGRG